MLLILSLICSIYCILFFKHKTAYEMRISDWSSDVCSSDLQRAQQNDGSEVRRRSGGRGHREHQTRTRHKKSPRPSSGAHGKETGIATGPGAFLSVQIGRASCRERVCQYV